MRFVLIACFVAVCSTYKEESLFKKVFELVPMNELLTTVPPTTVKPTGSTGQCKTNFVSCYKKTPIFQKYTCIFQFEDCLWKLCPVRPCFIDVGKCLRTVTSFKDVFTCSKDWAKCMKSHGCPKRLY